VEIPIEIYQYILMSRATIDKERNADNHAFWREWLEAKDQRRELGRRCSKRIRQIIKEDIEAECSKNEELQQQIRLFERVNEWLVAHGIDITQESRWSLDKTLNDVIKVIPDGLIRDLEECSRKLLQIKNLGTALEIPA
jgi:hypothetical protein